MDMPIMGDLIDMVIFHVADPPILYNQVVSLDSTTYIFYNKHEV
jgi:hypothetical protein